MYFVSYTLNGLPKMKKFERLEESYTLESDQNPIQIFIVPVAHHFDSLEDLKAFFGV